MQAIFLLACALIVFDLFIMCPVTPKFYIFDMVISMSLFLHELCFSPFSPCISLEYSYIFLSNLVFTVRPLIHWEFIIVLVEKWDFSRCGRSKVLELVMEWWMVIFPLWFSMFPLLCGRCHRVCMGVSWFASELSRLLYWPSCAPRGVSNSHHVTAGLQRASMISPWHSFFSIVWTILGLICFQINFRICFTSSTKNLLGFWL